MLVLQEMVKELKERREVGGSSLTPRSSLWIQMTPFLQPGDQRRNNGVISHNTPWPYLAVALLKVGECSLEWLGLATGSTIDHQLIILAAIQTLVDSNT